MTFKFPRGWRRWYFLVTWKSGRSETIETRDDYPAAVTLVYKILKDREIDSGDFVEEILLAPDKDWTN
jgi:hypothetical protein